MKVQGSLINILCWAMGSWKSGTCVLAKLSFRNALFCEAIALLAPPEMFDVDIFAGNSEKEAVFVMLWPSA